MMPVLCPICDGEGIHPKDPDEPCPQCNGGGDICAHTGRAGKGSDPADLGAWIAVQFGDDPAGPGDEEDE